MKVHYLLVFLLVLACYGCRKDNTTLPLSDCTPKNVKVGAADLMPETRAFMQKFVGKKVVFKNELGKELIFRDTGRLERSLASISVRINCNSGFWPVDKSYDFVELAEYRWFLVSDSFGMDFTARVTYDVSLTVNDTNKLFDWTYLSVYDNVVYCGVGFGTLPSLRGHSDVLKDMKNSTYLNPITVKDTTVNNKNFQNINVRKRLKTDLCTMGLTPSPKTPLEIYYRDKEGILAFKTVNNEFWFFDRIE